MKNPFSRRTSTSRARSKTRCSPSQRAGLCGSQKETSMLVSTVTRTCSAISLPWSRVLQETGGGNQRANEASGLMSDRYAIRGIEISRNLRPNSTRSGTRPNAGHDDEQVQLRIAAGLLGPETPDIMRRAKDLSHASTNPRVILFEPLQVVALAKAALLLLPADGTLRPDTNYRRFADALFRVSELIGPKPLR